MGKIQTRFNLQPKVRPYTVVPYLIEGKDVSVILEAVNELIDSKYKGNRALKVLEQRGEGGKAVAVGSNSLVLPIVFQVVAPQFRVAKPSEIEATLQEGDPIRIEGNHYVDYGLVLDFSGNNHDLAVGVYNSLPRDLRDLDRLPATLVGYGLRNTEVGRYGVAPTFQEGTELTTAKILAEETGNFDKSDSQLTKTGLPSRLGAEGDDIRRLYTVNQREHSLDNLGLVRLEMDSYLGFSANNDLLALSNVDSQVVLVSGEATSQNKAA